MIPPSRSHPLEGVSFRAVLFLVWLLVAVGGSMALWRFGSEPGESPSAAIHWPNSSQLERAVKRPTLVVFLHPQCPCSRATVEEIAVLLARSGPVLDVRAVFVAEVSSERVEESGLWKQVATLPGVTAMRDPKGIEARKFGAATSGDAFLFDASGNLRFRGGLTASRGHAGDNIGVDSVVAVLEGTAGAKSAPAFGCALFSDSRP